MVRFKNRWLLVEFLQPSQLAPAPLLTRGTVDGEVWRAPEMDSVDGDDGWSDEDESYPHASSSKLPFMLPLPSSPPSKPLLSGDAKTRQKNLSTYVRQSILETFGDDGHSKCSSLAVSYFSPTTSLAILRISRDHYRLAWSAINLMTEIEGISVVPRVIAVSGTLSKLCLRAQTYHRMMTARMLTSCLPEVSHRMNDPDTVAEWKAERAELEALASVGG